MVETKGLAHQLERANRMLNRVLVTIAGAILVIMMLLACVNVALRSLGYPVKGTFELVGFFGAVVAAFALGRTQMAGEHISVDVLIARFPGELKRILTAICNLLGMVFFALAGWETARQGTTLWRVQEMSGTLHIVYFPFVYTVSLGCFVLALVLFLELLKNGRRRDIIHP